MKISIGVAAAAIAGTASVGFYNIYQAMPGTSSDNKSSSDPLTSGEVAYAARTFLETWSKGDDLGASQRTDSGSAAYPRLTSFRGGLDITALKAVPGRPSGPRVPFTVTATVSSGEAQGTWTYDSELTVVRGRWASRW